jgi:glutathione S-transferase
MTTPKLTYLPINGRGFAIRAALRYANFPYQDFHLSLQDFTKQYKMDITKSPLGTFPTLEIPGEGLFVQSTAIARWAARKTDLYPENEIDRLITEEVMEVMNEMNYGVDPDEEVKKMKRIHFVNDILPRLMKFLETRLTRSGGPFLLGKQICIADLTVFGMLDLIYAGNLDYVPKDEIEKKYLPAHTLYLNVKEHPIAKAELETAKL